jgi:hypothetical protein
LPLLADIQAGIRAAVVGGDASAVAPLLMGGREPLQRFAIHQRHFRASLARALTEKFPATVWLAGSDFVTRAATEFAQTHPPAAPCIAEYGGDFPGFLARQPGAGRVPCLQWIAELEWHVGHTVLAVESPPMSLDAAAAIDPDQWPGCVLRAQPGLRYLAAPWPVDDLLRLFLSETDPAQYAFDPLAVFLHCSA